MATLTPDKPDFSGEWILNREASTLSPGADGMLSGIWRIEHREPTFHHKAAFVTESNPIEYEYELRSDGPDLVAPEEGASLRWDGNALVVTFRTKHPDGEMLISFWRSMPPLAGHIQLVQTFERGAEDVECSN